jgi:hypothetical protein
VWSWQSIKDRIGEARGGSSERMLISLCCCGSYEVVKNPSAKNRVIEAANTRATPKHVIETAKRRLRQYRQLSKED